MTSHNGNPDRPSLWKLLRFAVGLKTGGYVGCLLINGARKGHRQWKRNRGWSVHSDPFWPADVLLGERDANEFEEVPDAG